MTDLVIQEINQFIAEQRLKENGIYCRLTRQGQSYFLEVAENLDAVKKDIFEDVERYVIESDIKTLVSAIKSDILNFMVNDVAVTKMEPVSLYAV